ncbi:MAG: hypothetical protein GXP63_04435 [DPANN group archaeon]|nr:hypothetical protein [DPANN group archaeon]
MAKETKTEKTLIGVVEDVVINGDKERQRTLYARIDTGASKSSMDSKLAAELHIGPIKRTKMVKSASGNRLRPIVDAVVILAGKKIRSEFTLADRSHMRFPILIGRDILSHHGFLIDPDREAKR